jgi:hypothetical protein
MVKKGVSVPGCLFASVEIFISPACRMASRFSGCEHNLTATIKPIRGNRENGFYKFPDVSFISPDATPYSRNVGEETELKTN